MKQESINHKQLRWAGVALFVIAAGIATGCRTQQPAVRTDDQIAADIQAKIKGESALAQQNIQVSVASGVATLNGTVADEASRSLAANDSGTVTGVKTVINDLTVQTAPPAPVEPAQAAAPPPEKTSKAERRHQKPPEKSHDADTTPAPPPPPQMNVAQTQNTPPAPTPAPPPPPQPVVKEVTIPAGTTIPIRITETLNSKTAQQNEAFHGALAADLGVQGVIAVRHGTPVLGRVADAREAAHIQGSALLSIELTEIQRSGENIPVVTNAYTKEGPGRGKNTVEKAGGGAALGAIIGALAGGGKGAAIGAAAGGATGTGVNAATRGQEVVIPTETLINFQLQSPITLRVTIPPPGSGQNENVSDPQLRLH